MHVGTEESHTDLLVTIQHDVDHWYFMAICDGTLHIFDGLCLRNPDVNIIPNWQRWWKDENNKAGIRDWRPLKINLHKNFGYG